MENVNNSIKKQSDMELSGIARLNLKDADVVQIWDEVSAYIEKNMSQSRGVNIPNFGTFSFVQKKLDIGGQNRYVLIQRPIFSIAEKFAQTHGLAFHKYPIAGVIPVHPLNYTAVAQETPFSRDQVELCVRHVLAVLNRSVAANRNVEFTFTGIGKLQIRHGKVKMKFFKEFVNECDMSGKAISDMQNRPHTADSVMSRNDSNRSQTRNTCVLPRINSRMGGIALNQLDSSININNNSGGAMDTITEENYESPRQVEVDPNQSYLAPVATLFSTDEANQSISHYIENQPNQQQEQQQQQQTVKFHVPDAMPILRGASETLAQETASAANLSFASPPSSIVYLSPNEAETVNSIMKQSAAPEHHTHQQQQQNSYSPIEVSVSASVPNLARPSSKTLLGSLIAPSSASSTSGGHHHHYAVACSHQNAGQELCYLCHQRQRRNVPVYLHEETKRREKEESQLLAQYQHLKDMDKQLRDEEKRNAQRVDRAKMDAFNLGMSEAIRSKKHERPKTCDVSRSFIFRKRCKTPPKFIKQQDLRDYLSKQIESKQRETNMTKEEIKFVEKFEQLQLAEELAAQRESYLKEKFQRQRDLKAALDVQVKHKPEELPRALPDSEVFGEWDAKNEKLAQAKMREIEAFKYNKEKIEQRKREELLNNLREQEIDSENVERMKEELKIDRANRFRRMVDMRQGLETNWSFAVREKKHRDLDDREHRMAHDGLLVHEQCDRYRRCAQCQRDLKNCGETNIWRDSRYAAGNRIIV